MNMDFKSSKIKSLDFLISVVITFSSFNLCFGVRCFHYHSQPIKHKKHYYYIKNKGIYYKCPQYFERLVFGIT